MSSNLIRLTNFFVAFIKFFLYNIGTSQGDPMTEEIEPLFICDSVCEACDGCPEAVPHEHNMFCDNQGMCDTVNKEVKGIEVTI